jgi:phage gp46-like protein
MEPRLENGDYIPDGVGGVVRCRDAEALLERVLFRLTAHRGQFPLLPDFGSRLYLLGRETPSQRLSAARQYVAEALSEEDVTITDVTLTEAGNGRVQVKALLEHSGTDLRVTLTV